MGSDSIEIIVSKIFSRIREIELKDLDISAHSLEFLKKYRDNASFFTEAYAQLLKKAMQKLSMIKIFQKHLKISEKREKSILKR